MLSLLLAFVTTALAADPQCKENICYEPIAIRNNETPSLTEIDERIGWVGHRNFAQGRTDKNKYPAKVLDLNYTHNGSDGYLDIYVKLYGRHNDAYQLGRCSFEPTGTSTSCFWVKARNCDQVRDIIASFRKESGLISAYRKVSKTSVLKTEQRQSDMLVGLRQSYLKLAPLVAVREEDRVTEAGTQENILKQIELMTKKVRALDAQSPNMRKQVSHSFLSFGKSAFRDNPNNSFLELLQKKTWSLAQARQAEQFKSQLLDACRSNAAPGGDIDAPKPAR